MRRILLSGAALLLLAGGASAQAPRHAFNCIGAEELEDDVFAVPFRPGSAQVTDAARSALAAAAQLMKAEPDRNACVLGHTDREGGQSTNVRLAASRARAVAEALAGAEKIAAGRLRSEARVAGFSRRTGNRQQRSVTIVVLPAAAPTPVPATPSPAGSQPPAAPAARPPQAAPQSPPSAPSPDAPARGPIGVPQEAPHAAPGGAAPAGPREPVAPKPAAPEPAPAGTAPVDNAPSGNAPGGTAPEGAAPGRAVPQGDPPAAGGPSALPAPADKAP